jgi:hypothetical protein
VSQEQQGGGKASGPKACEHTVAKIVVYRKIDLRTFSGAVISFHLSISVIQYNTNYVLLVFGNMAKWNSVFLALICTLFQTFVLGYKIDQSCTKQGVEDLVRDAMRSAFDMVAAARDRLEANPLDRDTAELIGFLFAKQNANPTQLQATGQLTKTLDVFRNIYNNFRIEFASNNDVLPDDVVRLLTHPCHQRR